jgi:Ca2+-binding EF-hand superfamily protein
MQVDLTFDESLTARSIFAKHAEAKVRTSHQLRGILSDLGQYPTQAELDVVLDTFNQKIAFEDVCRYLVFLKRKFMKPEPKDADTIRAFVALGGHHDRGGDINADDLRNACRRFHLTIDIDAMLKEVDEDGSGSIEYNEFKSMWDEANSQDSSGVQFAVDPDDAQSETEYLNVLREFLRAPNQPAGAAQSLNRQPSTIRRKQSTKGNPFELGRKNTLRLPPVMTQTSPSKAGDGKVDSDGISDDDIDTQQARDTSGAQRQATGNMNDPVYRRYMMTDPVVVGTRRGGKPTPRRPPPTLPPVNSPRTPRNPSPRGSAKQTPR